ncbi:hypothetical protein [Wolbachia endosymbiont of Ctenocephalides felis wCfeT]|uniref:hypothetical protein n=1 Tax=Wolbachia endosymbiont of Ctenocephalides felis wCfeT TaxID=2732593 RepID=UPI0014462C24|nr:hypothetical protein [Wolbachia endosymbiont of Ctenocephalides felis wCfeT]
MQQSHSVPKFGALDVLPWREPAVVAVMPRKATSEEKNDLSRLPSKLYDTLNAVSDNSRAVADQVGVGVDAVVDTSEHVNSAADTLKDTANKFNPSTWCIAFQSACQRVSLGALKRAAWNTWFSDNGHQPTDTNSGLGSVEDLSSNGMQSTNSLDSETSTLEEQLRIQKKLERRARVENNLLKSDEKTKKLEKENAKLREAFSTRRNG